MNNSLVLNMCSWRSMFAVVAGKLEYKKFSQIVSAKQKIPSSS